MMDSKGQMDYPIIWFVIILFVIFLLAPIILKVFTSIQTPLSDRFGNSSNGAQAQSNFNYGFTLFTNFWDKMIVFVFVGLIIVLLISAFLVDTYPFFIILYLMLNFVLILIVPSLQTALNTVYDSSSFNGINTEVAKLPFTYWLQSNLTVIVIGVMVLGGIIIYGKAAFSKGQSTI